MAVAHAQFDFNGGSRSNGNGGGASPVYGVPEEHPEDRPQQQEEYTPQVFRHVFVHSAPDE